MASDTVEPVLIKHPHFDLMLPADQMLERLVGCAIKERRACHEWPLSCVERVEFEGGLCRYCKSMRLPTMEVEAYCALQSPVLVPHRVVLNDGNHSILLLDSYPGTRLTREVVESVGINEFFSRLREALGTITGPRPVFLDLSTVDKVRGHMSVMLERLYRLFGAESNWTIPKELLRIASVVATTRAVEESFVDDAVYSNGDLSADNILMCGDDIRIIDWQFPRIASYQVEMVNLCTSLSIDPRTTLSKAAIAAGLLCKIRWFAECTDLWIYNGGYDVFITGLLTQIAQLDVGA